MDDPDLRVWYWLVAGDPRPWSSAKAIEASDFAAGYVTDDDEGYRQFLDEGCKPTRIVSENELRDVEIAMVPGLAMIGRLTDAEYVALRQAEQANVAAGVPGISRFLDMLRTNGRVNLFGRTAEAAKAALVAAELLSRQRVAAIFVAG